MDYDRQISCLFSQYIKNFVPCTGIPKTTLLAIMIAAPVGGIMLFLICVMMCVIVCLCVRQSRLSNSRDNYNFQRLSIAAQDSDEEEEEDVEQG